MYREGARPGGSCSEGGERGEAVAARIPLLLFHRNYPCSSSRPRILATDCFIPQSKRIVVTIFIKIYALLTKREVKKAGY